jgi:hypothetical protein
MKTTTIIVLSKTEITKGKDGKWYYKELSRHKTCEGAPNWWDRSIELKIEGLDDSAIAKRLNKEGFKSVHGKEITTDKIRCLRSNLKRRKK